MKKNIAHGFAAATLLTGLAAADQSALAQPAPRSTIAQSLTPPALPLSRVEAGLIPFPLPKDSRDLCQLDHGTVHFLAVD